LIDLISRYIAVISAAAIAGLSVFNVGYFWKIGLHFIGLIDLTNLAYSFGLAFSAVSLVVAVAVIVAPRNPTRGTLIALGVVGGGLSLWGIWKFSPRTLEPQLLENGAILVGFAITGTAAVLWRLHENRRLNWRVFVLFIAASVITVFQAGSLTAALQLPDRFTYTVSTKDGDMLHGVRILHSASGGLIFVQDGHIIFLPQAEIKSVRSD
jgi:hypothetical protein